VLSGAQKVLRRLAGELREQEYLAETLVLFGAERWCGASFAFGTNFADIQCHYHAHLQHCVTAPLCRALAANLPNQRLHGSLQRGFWCYARMRRGHIISLLLVQFFVGRGIVPAHVPENPVNIVVFVIFAAIITTVTFLTSKSTLWSLAFYQVRCGLGAVQGRTHIALAVLRVVVGNK
jgi:hypothetical protein